MPLPIRAGRPVTRAANIDDDTIDVWRGGRIYPIRLYIGDLPAYRTTILSVRQWQVDNDGPAGSDALSSILRHDCLLEVHWKASYKVPNSPAIVMA